MLQGVKLSAALILAYRSADGPLSKMILASSWKTNVLVTLRNTVLPELIRGELLLANFRIGKDL